MSGSLLYSNIEDIINRCCEELESKYFQNTVFAPIENLLPRQRGKVYEKIASYIIGSKGYCYDKSNDTDYDILVNNSKVEIKGALSVKGDERPIAVFNHIGMKKNWDHILFLCLTGNGKIYMSHYTKESLSNLKIMKHQQGGSRSSNDDFMISGKSSLLLFSSRETNIYII